MFDCINLQHHFSERLAINSNSLALCRFGPTHDECLVAICQTLDKLVVLKLSQASTIYGNDKSAITHIYVNEIVRSLAVVSNHSHDDDVEDFLLIGCVSCLLIYDTSTYTNLLRVNTSTSIDNFSTGHYSGKYDPILCGGLQKISSMRLYLSRVRSQPELANGEITSEKSTSDTITCLIRGDFQGLNLVVTGSVERKIRVYCFDMFDYNVQKCELSIEAAARINCLCAIITERDVDNEIGAKKSSSDREQTTNISLLPSLEQRPELPQSKSEIADETGHMNHIAFGLENGSVGVYRLYRTVTHGDQETSTFSSERIWLHKSKQTPITMMMMDLNDDGYDELVIGYESGKLEVRSPLSGQLLGYTKCFKSDRLVGIKSSLKNYESLRSATNDTNLEMVDSEMSKPANMLLACSSNGQVVRYEVPRQDKKKLLRCFASGSGFGVDYDRLRIAQDKGLLVEDSKVPSEQLVASMITPMDNKFVDLNEKITNTSYTVAPSDSKQNSSLIDKISRLQDDQEKLKQKACEVHHSIYQEFTTAGQLAEGQKIGIAHRWTHSTNEDDYTAIVLDLKVSSSDEPIDFLELIEQYNDRPCLIDKGHMIFKAKEPEKSDHSGLLYEFSVRLIPTSSYGSQINLKVWSATEESKLRTKLIEQKGIGLVHEQQLILPRYIALNHDHVIKFNDKINKSRHKLAILSYELNSSKMEQEDDTLDKNVLEWLGHNMLCFRTNRWITENNLGRSIGGLAKETTYTSSDQRIDHTVVLNLIHQWDSPTSMRDQEKRDPAGSFKFELAQRSTSGEIAMLTLSYDGKMLRLGSDDFDLLMDVVKLLVVEHLEIDMVKNRRVSKPGAKCDDLKPMLDDMTRSIQRAKEFQESERRIQTELYESSDIIGNLFQQFKIAQQIDEFTSARDLLTEIAIVFDGAQNSSQAFNLNSRERSRAIKYANELRENITFLLGQ